MKAHTFRYKFKFPDRAEQSFEINLKRETMDLIHSERKRYPHWTKLEVCKCPHCPLVAKEHKQCPIAASLIDVIDFFKDFMSYDNVDIAIEVEERTYLRRTSLQYGISSLIGIHMVTAGCPYLDKLRPMVRFHLPFPSVEETTYRVISMYLFAQYFLYKQGKQPDWDLKHLIQMYGNISIVNKSFAKRLREIEIKDASLNAVMILDVFANFIVFSIDETMFTEIKQLFAGYWREVN